MVGRLIPSFALLSASLLPAQIPDGDYVAATFKVGTFLAPAGLFSITRDGASVTPITNLPPDVDGSSQPATAVVGPQFVLVREDGLLVTNSLGPVGSQMSIFVLALTGSQVSATRRYDLGTVNDSSSLGVPAAANLPGGAILIAIDGDDIGQAGDPLNGELLGIVDPTAGPPGAPGTILPVPVLAPRPGGDPNAMALDLSRGRVYLGMVPATAGASSEVWSVPFPGGGAATLVGSMSDTITGMAIDNDGSILLTASGSGGLHRMDTSNGNVTRIAPSLTNLASVAVDRASGEYVVATGSPFSEVKRIDGAGVVTNVTAGPMNGWGVVSSVRVRPNPAEYGPPSPGANFYAWQLAPNPGGLPLLGNAGFSVTVEASPAAPTASVLVASAAPLAPTPVLGIEVLVDPAFVLASVPQAGVASTTWALPVPNAPVLAGATLFVQSAHLDTAGLAASRGLRITVR